ncbi:ParB/RepB/Spo0J family partition protein [Candidatus Saccharibacteria bacterium]|nr:ParB/RepB/Spo0J family partition protein [Candidatus Saccharibacteria bacterium]
MNKGLGKDFSSLIPDDMLSEALAVGSSQDMVEQIALTRLVPDPQQPRKHFDEASLSELAASITEHGIVQPLIVAKNGSQYIIIAGERRYRAAQLAGLSEAPVIVRSFGEQEKLEIALIENIQRQDLTILDLAAAYLKLHDQFGLTYDEVAKKVGKSSPAVHNIIRLLKLPLPAKQALHEGKIVEGHARQIVALKDEATQLELLRLIITNKWTVRQAEQFVVGYKQTELSKTAEKIDRTKTETPETKQLSQRLKTPVIVKHMAKGGQLVIKFKSDEHLKSIVDSLIV